MIGTTTSIIGNVALIWKKSMTAGLLQTKNGKPFVTKPAYVYKEANMIIRKEDRIYDIRWNYGHSDLYCNGEFIQSCTDEDEAYRIIEELEDAA